MNLNTISILFIGSSIVSTILAFYALKRRNDIVSNSLAVLLFAVSIWSLFYGIEIESKSLVIIKLCLSFEYIGIANIASLWFIYASRYSGTDKWLTKTNITLLFVIPVFIWLMVVTNDYHYLFYSSNNLEYNNGFYYINIIPGVFYWLHIVYSYCLVLLGFIKVFRMLFQVSRDSRLQIIQVLSSLIIPYSISIAYILGVKPYGFIDLTPIGFLLMGVILSYAAFKNNMLEIKPLALLSLFDSIPDAIFVLDNNLRIISTNPPAKKLKNSTYFQNIDSINELFIGIINENSTRYIKIENIDYLITINSIFNNKDVKIGTMVVFRDITSQKKIENALLESEEQHRLMFETAREGIFVVQDGKLVFFNPLISKLSGYSPKELQYLDFLTLVHPDDKDLIAEDFKNRISGQDVEKLYEARFINKAGLIFWIELSSVKFSWKGNPATLNFLKDISVQKQTSNLQNILMSMSNTYINAELDLIDEKINNSLREIGEFVNADRSYIFEYDWDKQVCNNTYEWRAEGISSEKDNLQAIPMSLMTSLVENHLNNKHMFISDVSELPEDDSVRQILEPQNIVSLITIPLMNNNQCIGFVGFDSVSRHYQYSEQERYLLQIFSQMLVNIQHRKESNELINQQIANQKLISEISSEFVSADSTTIEAKVDLMLEKLGKFFKVDRCYILKYSDDGIHESNTNEWCAPGIHSEMNSIKNLDMKIFPWWKKQTESKQVIYIKDTSNLPPEAAIEVAEFARQKIKSIICIPIINNDCVFGYLGFDSVENSSTWDDTQIEVLKVVTNILGDALIMVNNENQLIRAKELAVAGSVAKSEFLSNMSHEIRTPLNGVIGFTELLRNTKLNETQNEYLDNAIKSALSLLNVVSDILDFSKIEAGKLDLELVKTDIVQLLENASDMIKVHAANKKLELLLNIQPNLPRFALIDPIRLKQILVNLMSNAVKFTHSGEVELKLRFEKKTDKTGIYKFEIRDTGIGIKEADMHKLFKAFSQADTSTTRRYGGTGLGLIISNSLAQKMGSSISLESEFGKGSKFSFSIETEFEIAEQIDKKLNDPITRILIVDDNLNNRTILEHNCQYWGIKTQSCESGFNALEILEKDSAFDLVIVDYHMPELDGIETIRMIRKNQKYTGKKLSIIMLQSSADDISLREASTELDIKFMLTKPVKSDELYQYIKNIELNINTNGLLKHDPENDVDILNLQRELKVLIAEDALLNMMVVTKMLKNILPNIQIFEAENGLKVLKLLETITPDIILMDVQMPEMDGIETTINIRKNKAYSISKIPIIALTAGVSKQERDQCFDAGMNDFLPKPIDKNALDEIIKKYGMKESNPN